MLEFGEYVLLKNELRNILTAEAPGGRQATPAVFFACGVIVAVQVFGKKRCMW